MLTASGTSKYHANETLLGRNGTFLASLAAMSLLTITSRHHEYRSHNSVTFHHSKAVDRQLPAAAHHEVHGKHGTRVTVRNLFGNLPVRVKQRSMVSERGVEQDRLWEGLKRDVAGLLLSWQAVVSLKLRDGNNRVVLNLNTSSSGDDAAVRDKHTVKPRSAALNSLLNILTQASYISVDEWASWVPASASTCALSLKGAISLDPAPSRHVQFISLGVRPLSTDAGHNELYDEVNRLFALSSFGTIEDDAEVDEHEKIRRQSDKRFKKDGYTNRQLKARKDVDRYPMFHLRISLKEGLTGTGSEDQLIGDETNLQNVMEVMGAMIIQWLSVHHFRPRQPRKRRERPGTASSALSDSTETGTRSAENTTASKALTEHSATIGPATPRPNSMSATARKRKRPDKSETSERLQHHAFAEWSRIKSGKSDFFNGTSPAPKLANRTTVTTSPGDQHNTYAKFEMQPVPRGAFSAQPTQEEGSVPASTTSPRTDDKENDDTILWTDPSTKKTYLLNARTGCVVPDARPRPNTDSAAPKFGLTQQSMNKSMRLPSRPSTAVPGKTPWLDDVLQSWDNPVFKPAEKRIQQIALHDDEFEHGNRHSKHGYSRIDMDEAFREASTSGSSRLSKEGLQHAQVISQVDKKFILVKMRRAPSAQEADTELLVLIDQHAADERVQVESLLKELCTPLQTDGGYQAKLGHKAQVASVMLEKALQFIVSGQERSFFITHAARFAAWGVLFDVLRSASTSPSGTSVKEQYVLSVTTLPPAIAERCKADPKVLISFLRSTVWKFADDAHLLPLPLPNPSSPPTDNSNDWVRRLSTCPAGLIDIVNSRACRSAIMFNDVLSQEECEELVGKLAECVFPFMCAHGRPSMVPLVDLGKVGVVQGGLNLGGEGDGGMGRGFVEAWKGWKR
jgi:DNA mismatch repair protein MLH3